MMRFINYYLTVLLAVLALSFDACKKEENLPPAAAPVIAVLSISPDTLVQFQDSVIIELQYEDQNGDLGSDNPDQLDLEILL